MKLIFLDIDGVLVTRRIGVFEEPLLMNLKKVVEQTGAKIVLSSDWRRHPTARLEARRVLGTVGLNFIGCTPCLSAYIAQRPTEIMQWKREHTRRADGEKVTQWIAIDDRALLEERHGQHLQGHFVQTQPMRGLVESVADECVRILNQGGNGAGNADAPSQLEPEGSLKPLPHPIAGRRNGPAPLGNRGCSTGPVHGFGAGHRLNGNAVQRNSSAGDPVAGAGEIHFANTGGALNLPAMGHRHRGRSADPALRPAGRA
mmetsp:Transcript_53606/g.149125  ORF Transcript_53606/g.149125 Transcript_53606/m.149125 type:complete len:258 (-) Transcript_53606:96-869(-)